MEEEKKSFVFYRSFYKTFLKLNNEDKITFIDSLCKYSLDKKETKLEGILDIVWESIKPQLDSNFTKWENGKLGAKYGSLGGRPKKEEIEITPPKPHRGKKITPNVDVNVDVNANVDVNEDNIKKSQIYYEE